MSVYIQDGMVLLNGGSVAIDATCCCGCDCPTDNTVCVTFSGILQCPCVNIGAGKYINTNSSLDGSFTLTKTIEFNCFVQWEGNGGAIHLRKYNNAICDTPIEECDCVETVPWIILQCIGPPTSGTKTHNLVYAIPFLDVCLSGWGIEQVEIFKGSYSGNLIFGVPENNELTALTCLLGSGTGIPVGKDGTMTVESGLCP